jgi:hypothetical protein
MTLTQINKEIEKKEILISKLSKNLHKNPNTATELNWRKEKEILYHLYEIQLILTFN